MHHRYFECNYSGSDASFMDEIFGTFRTTFKCVGSHGEGGSITTHGRQCHATVKRVWVKTGARSPLPATVRPSRECDKGPGGATARPDAKATLWGLPSPSFVAFLALSALSVGAWAAAAGSGLQLSLAAAAGFAFLAGCGPLAAAYALTALSRTELGGSGPESWRSVALHAGMGALLCAAPICWAAFIVLRPPPSAAAAVAH